MQDSDDSTFHRLPEAQMLLVNRLCNLFEAKWKRGEQATVEEFLTDVAQSDHSAAINELLPLEIEYRARAEQQLPIQDYLRRFPKVDRTWLSGLLASTHITDDASEPEEPEVPEKLGDYRILSRIGGGGMGTVYKALHERMGRTVALKILRPEIQRDPGLLKRFDREVRVAARLSHPNIVAALDAREQDGIHFLITEYIDGTDLEAIVRRDGPLSVRQAVECILQAARGLDYAHQQGVIHRDMKPANLLRDSHGTVKVLDMGLARLDTGHGPTSTELTETGMVMGTAAYMAPEQARDTSKADARSDVYSLGCTLYFLLMGRSMFVGASMIDTLLDQVSKPAPTLIRNDRAIPDELQSIFRRMVAKDPAERFQSMGELVAALQAVPKEKLSTQQIELFRPSPEELRAAMDGGETEAIPARDLRAAVRGEQSTQRPHVLEPPDRRRLLMGGTLVLIVVAIGIVGLFRNNGSSTLPGPVPKTPPQRRFALGFNGRSSYVEVPQLIPIEGETYTIEVVARPRTFRTSNVISWLGPDWMAIFVTADGKWGLGRLVNKPLLSQASISSPPNVNVHLAGIFETMTLQLYINGKLTAIDPIEFGLADVEGGLFLGGVDPQRLPAGQNDRFFNGEIHAVRISRGRRYNADFAVPATLEADDDTIAAFSFAEGQGEETVGTGSRKWRGRLIDVDWIRLR